MGNAGGDNLIAVFLVGFDTVGIFLVDNKRKIVAVEV